MGGSNPRSEQEHISCFNLLILFLVLSAAFIAALYIDKDLEFVHTFMNVCFFPRLKVRHPPPSPLTPKPLAALEGKNQEEEEELMVLVLT